MLDSIARWLGVPWCLFALAACGAAASPQEPYSAAPLWIRDGAPTPQSISLIHILCSAEAYGLRAADYLDCPRFEQALGAGAPGQPSRLANAEFDTGLTTASMRFLHDIHFGRIDPRQAGFDLSFERPPLHYEQILDELSRTSNVDSLLASLEPQFEHYRLLKAALARYRALTFGQAVAPTPAELRSAPYDRRIRQIELTLERWRWLPELDSPPIIVNIPQFRLFAFESTRDVKAEILQMDVIVGRTFPKLRTPVFAADLKYVVFRPYWDVPYSITQKEMLPELRNKPDFWKKEHLELVDGQGDSAPVVPFSPQSLEQLAAGKLRLRQQPGPDNALGLIKFMLPNPYNVYLHSTPARRLFNQSRRAFSHGCIRVSDPVELASYVLRNAAGTWTPEAIAEAMNGPGNAVRVSLKKPIRVLILYGTALAREDGVVMFFDDIYGHDRRLEGLLGLPLLAASKDQRR